MQRRDIMVALGGIASIVGVANAAPPPPKPAGTSALADAAAECVKRGEACLQHCLDMMASGDKTMGACALADRDMLAGARCVQTLAIAGSKNVKAMAKAAAQMCSDCEAECRKHEHPPCKACAEACAAFVREVGKLG